MPACGISARRITRTARCFPIVSRWEREAGSLARHTGGADSASWRRPSRRVVNCARGWLLLAGMLSVPLGDRYPKLELSPQRLKQRTFDALIGRLERLAKVRPVLMLFEDAQWADPSSLRTARGGVDRSPNCPCLDNLVPCQFFPALDWPPGSAGSHAGAA